MSMAPGVDGEREAAFRAVYDATRHKLLAYALRRTRNHDDAADVVADVFLIAWRRLEVVPRDGDALLWLYATARRVLANRSRRTETRSKVIERLRLELEHVDTDVAGDLADSLAARHVLQELSDDDREILMLTGWEGLSSPALAYVLGCSVTAARIRLHRARGHLRTGVAEAGIQVATKSRDRSETIPAVEKA